MCVGFDVYVPDHVGKKTGCDWLELRSLKQYISLSNKLSGELLP